MTNRMILPQAPNALPDAAVNLLIHKVNCVIKYGELSVAIKWCEENISRDWRWQMTGFPGKDGEYIFYFEHEEDAVVFALHWS